MFKLKGMVGKTMRDERGITGLETAIILIAFVVVATVFAFVVLTTGIFSAERGKETVFAGLQKARGTMEVRGGVVVQATTCPATCTVSTIEFNVATTAGGESIPLDPSATNNRTVISYRDAAGVANDVPYTVTWVVGAGPLLDPGELATINIDTTLIDTDATTPLVVDPPTIGPNDRWTLELQTPVGAVIDITRSMPAALDAVMQLH